ncbi:Rho GTPase-activating protein 44, partial [Ilyodon furcidens]
IKQITVTQMLSCALVDQPLTTINLFLVFSSNIKQLFALSSQVEIPNIQKQRKHLAKLVLDMDSARTRYYQSNKSSGLSTNLQPTGAKADHLREEMEEAANRMEICRVSEYYFKCQ